MTHNTTIALLSLILLAGPVTAQMSHDEHAGPAMNFVRIDDSLATGGHIVGEGLGELTDAGVTLVVDLRDDPPKGYAGDVAAAGVDYVNIPVSWRSPKVSDFEQFRDAMNANPDAHVLVQCQANYRASAFTYLYRVLEFGVPEAEARADMNRIWEPEGTWADYIDAVKGQFGTDD
jgi:protein tyrosine phosphatase (PTP) superfamily phosphohydrolase (DUF442 family)